MCNDNDFDIRLIGPQAKFYDWSLKAGANTKSENTQNPRFPLGTQLLQSKTCIDETAKLNLSTGNRYSVAAQLEGNPLNADGSPKSSQTGEYTRHNIGIFFNHIHIINFMLYLFT